MFNFSTFYLKYTLKIVVQTSFLGRSRPML